MPEKPFEVEANDGPHVANLECGSGTTVGNDIRVLLIFRTSASSIYPSPRELENFPLELLASRSLSATGALSFNGCLDGKGKMMGHHLLSLCQST